jgi:hypothetical protein
MELLTFAGINDTQKNAGLFVVDMIASSTHAIHHYFWILIEVASSVFLDFQLCP